MIELLPGSQHILAGFRQSRYPVARRESVLQGLEQSDIAVFATHAVFNVSSPWLLSEIHLARNMYPIPQHEPARGVELLPNDQFELSTFHGQNQQFNTGGECHRLSLADLFETEIRTSLIVLSACESALTDHDDLANENIGFPSMLIAAGARTVIGSLWKVDDRATALFNSIFFRNLFKHGSKIRHGAISRAVSDSQREIRSMTSEMLRGIIPEEQSFACEKPFEHPVFWAAFGCYGAP